MAECNLQENGVFLSPTGISIKKNLYVIFQFQYEKNWLSFLVQSFSFVMPAKQLNPE